MDFPRSCQIHPTAVISPDVELADNVVIGPFVVLEGPVTLGEGCVLRPYVHLIGPLKMGRQNQVYSGAVLGEKPQHLKYNDELTAVEIGHNNIFRENVTVHRGTTHSWTTRLGDNNFLMAGCHVAHDCQIANNCIMANNALLAGHCVLEDNVYISGNAAVHQFIRIGRLAMLSGCSATTKDMPPFIIQQGINNVVGVNLVGLRRAGMPADEINGLRKAFRIIFVEKVPLPIAIPRVEDSLGHLDAVREFVTFLQTTEKGINGMRPRGADQAA